MEALRKQFDNRDDLTAYVKALSPWAQGEQSSFQGGAQAAQARLLDCDPGAYANTRNFSSGKITCLSPYIQHGILSLNEVRNYALAKCAESGQVGKFIQELSWRDFWQRILIQHPEWAWCNVEAYKTGFDDRDYSETLPEDIATGKTGIACIDSFITELTTTGYVHNHARMYIASYIVHFRRIKWQAGAKWFLRHLLDGNVASNNFSWQWVASTFSDKLYVFNLENVDKYFSAMVDTSVANNKPLHQNYDAVRAQLFPNISNAA